MQGTLNSVQVSLPNWNCQTYSTFIPSLLFSRKGEPIGTEILGGLIRNWWKEAQNTNRESELIASSSYTFLHCVISKKLSGLFESQLLIFRLFSSTLLPGLHSAFSYFFSQLILINSASLVSSFQSSFIKIFDVQESDWYWPINFQCWCVRRDREDMWRGKSRLRCTTTIGFAISPNVQVMICLHFEVSCFGIYGRASKHLGASWKFCCLCRKYGFLYLRTTPSNERESWKLLTQWGIETRFWILSNTNTDKIWFFFFFLTRMKK